MNLHALRLFYEVARYRSVTKAAKSLNISQPSVTAQIKKFEAEEQVTLLTPQGRGIQLTPIAEQLFLEAEQLFAIESRIQHQLAEFHLQERANLKISGNYLSMNALVPTAVYGFKQQFPEIKVELATLNTQEAIEQLLAYKVDLAIVGGGALDYQEKINSKRLLAGELWFVANSEHPLANQTVDIAAIAKADFLGREAGSYAQRQLELLYQQKALPVPIAVLTYNGLNELIGGAVAGQGIAFCSSIAVNELVRSGALARIYVADVQTESGIYYATRKAERLPMVVDQFLALLTDSVNK